MVVDCLSKHAQHKLNGCRQKYTAYSDERETKKKILNTENKFVTLYVINSAQNIFIYYSVQYFTLKKIKFTRTNYFTESD